MPRRRSLYDKALHEAPKCAELPSIGRRGYARAIIAAPAELILTTGSGNCILQNLSISGAMVTANLPLNLGADALICIDGLELFGRIAWAENGSAGIAFDTPLPLNRVAELRHKAARIRRDQQDRAMLKLQHWVEGKLRV